MSEREPSSLRKAFEAVADLRVYLDKYVNKLCRDLETEVRPAVPLRINEIAEKALETALRDMLSRSVALALFAPYEDRESETAPVADEPRPDARSSTAVTHDTATEVFPAKSRGEGWTDESVVTELQTHVRIGRIIIHGLVPTAQWSHRECCRPVDFYLNDADTSKTCIHEKCRRCRKNRDELLESDDPVYRILPERWKKAVGARFENRKKPLCWPDHYTLPASLGLPPCEVQSVFGQWTLRDIIILARQRLKDFSINKTDMLPTQSQQLTMEDTRPTLTVYSRNYRFRADDTGVVCRDYLAACRAWCDHPESEAAKDAYERKRRTYELAFSLQHARQVQRMGPARPDYVPRLDTDRCILYSKWDDPCLPGFSQQGLISFSGIGSHTLVYFEFTLEPEATREYRLTRKQRLRHEDRAAISKRVAEKATEFGHSRNRKWLYAEEVDFLLDLGALLDYCQRTYREADKRSTNHDIVARAFPKGVSKELVAKTLEQSHQGGAGAAGSEVLEAYDLMITKFCRCVEREEDSPIHLSLALLRDFWLHVLQLGEPPYYSEYARFQQVLARLPEYRDHLVHSVQVFLLGHRILAVLEVGDPCLRMQWALASLMHDFGLPLEKASDVMELMFITFAGLRPKGGAPSAMLRRMLETHEKTHRALILALMSPLLDGDADMLDGKQDIRFLLSDAVYKGLASDRDHGFLSAVYLFEHLFHKANSSMRWSQVKDSRTERLKKNDESFRKGNSGAQGAVDIAARLRIVFACDVSRSVLRFGEQVPEDSRPLESVLLEVMDAIAKHNITAKERRLLFSQTPAFKYPEFKYPDKSVGAARGYPTTELARLLVLCDTLCDWGRIVVGDELGQFEPERRGVGGDDKLPESRPECRIDSIGLPDAQGHITIRAVYEWPFPAAFADIIETAKARGTARLPDRYWCLGYVLWWLHQPNNNTTCDASKGMQCHGLCAQCRGNPEVRDKTDENDITGMDDCLVVDELQRFWTRIVMPRVSPDGTNDLLSNINIAISFYGRCVFPVEDHRQRMAVSALENGARGGQDGGKAT